MPKFGVPQIHIIPFDLGVVFFDVLAIDNSKNLLFAEDFCDEMQAEAKKIIGNSLNFLKSLVIKRSGKSLR